MKSGVFLSLMALKEYRIGSTEFSAELRGQLLKSIHERLKASRSRQTLIEDPRKALRTRNENGSG